MSAVCADPDAPGRGGRIGSVGIRTGDMVGRAEAEAAALATNSGGGVMPEYNSTGKRRGIIWVCGWGAG